VAIGKPKKKIPLEKAIPQARQRLAPFWIRSKPLLWMDEETLRPLDPEFDKQVWCFLTFNLFQTGGDALFARTVAFFDRYLDVDVSFGLVSPVEEAATEIPRLLQEWISHHPFPNTFIADPAGALIRGLGLDAKTPSLVVYSKGKRALRWKLDQEPFAEFEVRFQSWLRAEDPGLPLEDPDLGDVWPNQ
jgi:hypothetical protein